MLSDQVQKEIQEIMRGMSDVELRQFAEDVGVQDPDEFSTRRDLEGEIVRLELYAFSH